MKHLPLKEFLGYLVGAGLVYVSFAIGDLVFLGRFNLFVFFLYWDLMFGLILFLNWFNDPHR